jgi:hypothetical protein
MEIARWDYDGVGEFLHTSPELQVALLDVAERHAAIVRETAPVGTPPRDEHPGEYRDNVFAEEFRGELDDRLAARTIVRVGHAAAVEWGNKRIGQHSTLLKAAEALTEE